MSKSVRGRFKPYQVNGKPIATPELDKLAEVRERAQAIGEFIEWLGRSKYAICESYREDVGGTWLPTPASIEKLLSEYFEIDLNKVENEKCAILEAVRR